MKRQEEDMSSVSSGTSLRIVPMILLAITAVCIILLTLDFLPVLLRSKRKAEVNRLVKPGDTRDKVFSSLGRAGFALVMDASTSHVGVLLEPRKLHTVAFMQRAGMERFVPTGLWQTMFDLKFDSNGLLVQGLE